MNRKSWRERDERLIHDGDCHFFDKDICTCGLLHHLIQITGDEAESSDWLWEETSRQDKQLDRVPTPEPYVKPTPEQIKEAEKLIEQIFSDYRTQRQKGSENTDGETI